MNPELLKLLQSLLGGSSGLLGLPGGAMDFAFGKLSEFTNQDDKQGRLNVDPLKDINAYKVNPYKGYLAKDGGPVIADEQLLHLLPMLLQLPGAQLTPQGIQEVKSGGMVGKLQMKLGELKVQQFQKDLGGFIKGLIGNSSPVGAAFVAGTDALFPNAKLNGPEAFGAYTLYRKQGKGDLKFNQWKKAVKNGEIEYLPGLASPDGAAASSSAGAGVPFSGFTPGASAYTPTTGSLFDRINAPQATMPQNNLGSLFTGPFNQGTGVFGMPISTPVPTTGFDANSLIQLLGQLQSGKKGGMVKKRKYKYQDGGMVGEEEPQVIPIQAETIGGIPEMILHLDGTITEVNATKPHSRMKDDEVTDLVPVGSYIASADKSMRMTFDEADKIVLGIKAQPYEERKKGKVPESIKLSSLWPSGSKKPMTPAEMAQRVLDLYPTSDKDDIFSKSTNQANITARLPMVMEIIKFNESKRTGEKGVVTMKHGGTVSNKDNPLRIKGVVRAPDGGWLDDVLGIAPTLIPLLGSLFGGGKANTPPGGVSPLVETGILSTIPQYQYGVTQNINAQSTALNQGIDDFSSLGRKLIDDARQSATIQSGANLFNTGLGSLNALAMETDVPRLDLSASRARINNFRPVSGSRAAIDAAATPRFDASAIMDQLGGRGAPLLSQLYSDQQRNVNNAATQRNQFLDQTESSKIQQLNQIDATEQPFNIGQQEKEIKMRGDQRNLLTGVLGSGVQRNADVQSGLLGQIGGIQSQILPITTQFALQNAGLAGQEHMLGAQNALNAYSVLGGIQSQNATANALNNPNDPLSPPPPPGGCPTGQVKICGKCVANTPDANGCLPGQTWVQDPTQDSGQCLCG